MPERRLELLGLHEIAEHYAISRQLAAKWTRRSDFPQPIAELAMGKVWDAGQVTAWAKKHDRKPGAGPRR
jgi:prophage regulatory protein